jgi:hypothetical protein
MYCLSQDFMNFIYDKQNFDLFHIIFLFYTEIVDLTLDKLLILLNNIETSTSSFNDYIAFYNFFLFKKKYDLNTILDFKNDINRFYSFYEKNRINYFYQENGNNIIVELNFYQYVYLYCLSNSYMNNIDINLLKDCMIKNNYKMLMDGTCGKMGVPCLRNFEHQLFNDFIRRNFIKIDKKLYFTRPFYENKINNHNTKKYKEIINKNFNKQNLIFLETNNENNLFQNFLSLFQNFFDNFTENEKINISYIMIAFNLQSYILTSIPIFLKDYFNNNNNYSEVSFIIDTKYFILELNKNKNNEYEVKKNIIFKFNYLLDFEYLIKISFIGNITKNTIVFNIEMNKDLIRIRTFIFYLYELYKNIKIEERTKNSSSDKILKINNEERNFAELREKYIEEFKNIFRKNINIEKYVLLFKFIDSYLKTINTSNDIKITIIDFIFFFVFFNNLDTQKITKQLLEILYATILGNITTPPKILSYKPSMNNSMLIITYNEENKDYDFIDCIPILYKEYISRHAFIVVGTQESGTKKIRTGLMSEATHYPHVLGEYLRMFGYGLALKENAHKLLKIKNLNVRMRIFYYRGNVVNVLNNENNQSKSIKIISKNSNVDDFGNTYFQTFYKGAIFFKMVIKNNGMTQNFIFVNTHLYFNQNNGNQGYEKRKQKFLQLIRKPVFTDGTNNTNKKNLLELYQNNYNIFLFGDLRFSMNQLKNDLLINNNYFKNNLSKSITNNYKTYNSRKNTSITSLSENTRTSFTENTSNKHTYDRILYALKNIEILPTESYPSPIELETYLFPDKSKHSMVSLSVILTQPIMNVTGRSNFG